ncbi:hypothetical protein TKK_0001392 [Trichogramma kaykai]
MEYLSKPWLARRQNKEREKKIISRTVGGRKEDSSLMHAPLRGIYNFRDLPHSYFIVGQCWASTDANAASTGLNVGPVLVGYWNDNSKSVLAASIMPVLTQYQLRTKTSFIEETQAEHHQPNIVSPLTKLSNFDPVKQVFLESMHLLYQGVMKMIISMFIEPGNNNKLSKNNRNDLKVELSRMSAGIPVEFERKTFDLDNFGYWKATQFRFFAGYLIVGQCWASTDTNAVSTGINVGPVLVGYWNDNSKSALAASIGPVSHVVLG